MISFNILKTISFLALVSSLVSAQVANNCDAFRITSPVDLFTTISGACYRVSYDLGPNPPETPAPISVDIYTYITDHFASNVVNRAPTTNDNTTPWFNIDLGAINRTDIYYFLVTYDECPSIASFPFNVINRPDLGIATCP